MLRRVLAAALVACLLPSPAFAWGFAAHRAIMRRAIDLLPPEIKPFFIEHREEAVFRALDPDLWRSVGWDDDHNHFVNFGAPELGPFPFTAYPREYGAALQKFGEADLKRLGTLPFREAEMSGNLQRALDRIGKGANFAIAEALVYAGAASHYIQDATQPLHASYNYDGQATDQRGVHSRFETELFERFESRLTLTPAPPKAIASPRDFAFDTLLVSHQKVDAVLKADKEAIGSKDTYDDAYFEAFFTKMKPMLEERLSTAITATASIIISAWEQAGRPALNPKLTRELRKVQRAR
jgi:hypothetical protein